MSFLQAKDTSLFSTIKNSINELIPNAKGTSEKIDKMSKKQKYPLLYFLFIQQRGIKLVIYVQYSA